MRSTRLLGAAGLVGSCLAIFACSASPTTKERTSEKLGVTRQALGAEYVCAMTHGTDYGYPVFDPTRGKTWFLFGDNFDVVGSPDPLGSTTSSTPTCAITRQDNPPIVLTGFDLGGSRTPIGAAYIPLTAPDTYGDRIIAGFTATTPGEPDANIRGVLGDTPAANPSTFAPILDDTDQAPILADPSHFFIMAPLVVKASAIGDPMTLPGTSTRILLVFGTGKPFRASGIYLAAVRLDRLRDRSSWRFLDANRTWASSVTSAARLFADMPPPDGGPYATGCAGEISVGYNAPFRKYMLVYKCYARYLNGRGPAEDGVVVMRTTESPLDSWSPPRALFAPKKEGIPDDGDDAYGSFMHRANLRLYRASLFDPLQRLPTDVVGRNEPECIRHNPPDCNCVATFPAACAPPDHDPLGFDETKGCCVESNKCCDRLYDRYPPESGGSGSGTDGASYAPSVVHAWSEALDGDAYHPTTRQNLYYVMSTWNPYQVVLMKNEIVDNDTDNDGRDDLHDNCPAAYNPGQENCNRAAEEAWNARHPEAPVDKRTPATPPRVRQPSRSVRSRSLLPPAARRQAGRRGRARAGTSRNCWT